MKPLIISFFFLSLHSIAAAVKCYSCHARNNVTCEQTIIQCPDGQQCLTICERLQFNGTFPSIYKGCSRNIPCGKTPLSRATDDVSLKYNTKCCDTDQCNDKFYEMPEDVEPIGDDCPSCFVSDSLEVCAPGNKTTKCRGKTDRCFKFAGEAEKPDGKIVRYSIQGCMSTMLCGSELDQLVGLNIFNQSIFECTNTTALPTTEVKAED